MAPVLTRELLYTGLTRARERFTLIGPAGADAVLSQALARRVQQMTAPAAHDLAATRLR
jgi:exodeoxyribonuclease V alpha subunit